MHEMSLAEGIRDIVEQEAAAQGVTRVRAVVLEIGQLAAVEVDALRFCFDVMMRGTPAEGSELVIESVPGAGQCLTCGKAVTIGSYYDPCPRCGNLRVQATGGMQMRVKAIDVCDGDMGGGVDV